MDNTNLLYERRNLDGTSDYVVNLGTILYNDKILNISNLLIPIRDQSFFDLPEDKGKFAAVNVYYRADTGAFVFDLVQKSSVFIQSVTADALSNHLPIAQFILKESLGSFDVVLVSPYSKMSTFSISTSVEQGDMGSQGPVGVTGLMGSIGSQGLTGYIGDPGVTGSGGVTGVGVIGVDGLQGVTGLYPDTGRLFYAKFKTDDLTLIDYSVYERDLGWGASGAGYFAYGATGVSNETGTFFVPEDPTEFVVEEGIKDNCHNIKYNGGWSSYSTRKFIGFTGSVQAWVRIDVPPATDFTYTVDPDNPLKVYFIDASTFFPVSWEWDLGVGGGIITVRSFTYIFSVHGTYVVSLKTSNAVGVSERVKAITI